jgi:hypothetical protein
LQIFKSIAHFFQPYPPLTIRNHVCGEESPSSASNNNDGSNYEEADTSASNDADRTLKQSYYVVETRKSAEDDPFNYGSKFAPPPAKTKVCLRIPLQGLIGLWGDFGIEDGEAEVMTEHARFPENLERTSKDWFETLTPAEQRGSSRPNPNPRKPHLIFGKDAALRRWII